MSRESHFMRRGFGIILAIIIMLTVATLMSLMVGLSTKSVNYTGRAYLQEQAKLQLRSSLEYTLLAISGHDNNSSCITDIEIKYPNDTTPTHISHVNISYLTTYNRPNCPDTHELSNISTQESDFTAIIDIVVEVNQSNTGITEPIKIHRRTIQKP
jgi:hypothetical protein